MNQNKSWKNEEEKRILKMQSQKARNNVSKTKTLIYVCALHKANHLIKGYCLTHRESETSLFSTL